MNTTRSRMNKNARESAKKRKFLSSFNAETSAEHKHDWYELIDSRSGKILHCCSTCDKVKEIRESGDDGLYGNEAEFKQEVDSGHW